MRGKRFTRRRAVAGSAALAALLGQGGWWHSGQADDAAAAPLDEVSVAILGCGIRGPAHAEELLSGRHGARVS